MNSLVGKPDAERAATRADGPGIGITGISLSTQTLAYIQIPKENISEHILIDFISSTNFLQFASQETCDSPVPNQDH